MGMQKGYSRVNWQNKPNMSTPLGKTLLNHMDVEINKLDDRTVILDATKLSIETANSMLVSLSIDPKAGIIKATQLDGTECVWDLNLEKIPVKMALTEDAVLVMETEDGQTFQADLKGLIDTYIFDDSDTLGFSQTSEEDGKHVTAGVKKGSLTEEYLNPEIMAEIRQSKLDAKASASDALGHSQMSKRWSIGDKGVPGSDTDNAKYYKEQTAADALLAESFTHGGTGTREGEDTDNAEYYKKQAEAVSAVEIANPDRAGIVKPDGVTITSDADGTLHGADLTEVLGFCAKLREDMGTYITLGDGWIQIGNTELHYVRIYFDGSVRWVDATTGGTLENPTLISNIRDTVRVGNIANHGLTTAPGFVADARQLNPNIPDTLAAQVASLNSDLGDLETQFQGYKIYAKSGTVSISASIGTINTGIKSLDCHLAFCKKDGDTSVLAYANIDGVGKITVCVKKYDGSSPTLTIGYSLILFYK